MIKIIKMTFVFLLAVMTVSAILVLINEPKNIGSYAAIIIVTFFDIVAFFALFHKNNRLYQALNDPSLGEESEND